MIRSFSYPGSALAAVLATGLVTASAVAAHGAGSDDSAYALQADGLVPITATPSVDGANGSQQKSLLSWSSPDHLVSAGALNATASANQAASSVTDLAVAALNASLVRAQCDDGNGSASLAKASLAGTPLDAAPPPNTTVAVPGVGSVTLNKETTNPDGSLTVTAIRLALHTGQTVNVASATCSRQASATQLPEAPPPTAVSGHLPVTG